MQKPYELKINSVVDSRGALSVLQSDSNLPFTIARVYWLYDVPENQVRGGHAHKSSEQVIICLNGEVSVTLESTTHEQVQVNLNDPSIGLYIPPMWWGHMEFKNGAILMGLASDEFSEEDYIRDKRNFK